jgi:enoyl-[acyl-carrier protein] reductase/trans-2-enoyl-CoA reductase (NAD+)
MDAFSHDAKAAVIEAIKADLGQVDLVVYSLASPRRQDPDSEQVWSSVLKPIGDPVSRKTLNTDTGEVTEVTLEPANEAEIQQTVKVMGGEDWELWMAALDAAGVLAPGVKTTAYTYIGKALTWPIYGHATIGKAKEDLDRAARAIDQTLGRRYGGEAKVSVLKALVTQAAAAIPVMPLYISLLYKVMKGRGTHEGAIEHVYRLFTTALYGNRPAELVDDQGRLRIDLWELDDAVQSEVERLWHDVDTHNVEQLADVDGYRHDFFALFGFGFPSVDYEVEVDPRGLDQLDS